MTKSLLSNLKGSMVALVTPFDGNSKIDINCWERLVKLHLESNTQALIIAGTTGESPNISDEELGMLINSARGVVKDKIKIIAGTGTNSTATTIHRTKLAFDLGVDGALVVTPYYNKPTQLGLFEHYKEVSINVPGEIILYNVPGRTGINLELETIVKLASFDNIIGIKDATDDINRVICLKKEIPEFKLFSGEDSNLIAWMASGGDGIISVTANIVPGLIAKVCKLMLDYKYEEALLIHKKLIKLHSSLFIETNPIAVKWLLSKLGYLQNILRLPLTPLAPELENTVWESYQEIKDLL